MVSLRRRRLLGLCSRGRNFILDPLPPFFDSGFVPATAVRSSITASVHPTPLVDTVKPEEVTGSPVGSGHAIASVSGLSKDQIQQENVSASFSSKEQKDQQHPEQEFKRRKRHRRKHIHNQEQCVMRGVYFKNMKWQAAIKVEKKQIHLGTVGSQEEAARLYDRAAFMCGREPNFELTDEEKQELRKYKWDEFLAMTRRSITSKKGKRRHGVGSRLKPETTSQNSDSSDGGQVAEELTSGSDEAEQETSTS
ncbi:Ethylene-responsive transcription factor-like protein [Drosera capensis]